MGNFEVFAKVQVEIGNCANSINTRNQEFTHTNMGGGKIYNLAQVFVAGATARVC